MNWYFQLFSARNTPLSETLSVVAQAGYAGVEAYRDNFGDVEAFKLELDKHALSVPSIHINIGDLRSDLDACIARAALFDCAHIVCPYLEPAQRPADAVQWQALGHELEGIASALSQASIAFAWHNHDFEFGVLTDGTAPLEHLMDNAPSMTWEIDVAWIVRAGADPVRWINQYQSRISAVHLKDLAPTGELLEEDGWADLGEGVVAWEQLMSGLLKSPAAIYVTEHDNPADLERFATRSISAAQALSDNATDHAAEKSAQ